MAEIEFLNDLSQQAATDDAAPSGGCDRWHSSFMLSGSVRFLLLRASPPALYVVPEQMERHDNKMQLIASALYEIRLLLSSYLGSGTEADQGIREAAHLSYALHNEAEAVLRGGDFDLDAAIRRIEAIEVILPGSKISKRVLCSLRAEDPTAQQAGAGQPATRPVDKPVGGDKPQPEAEGRRP